MVQLGGTFQWNNPSCKESLQRQTHLVCLMHTPNPKGHVGVHKVNAEQLQTSFTL